MEHTTYLDTLIARQRHEGWSDRQMAVELGLDRSSWFRIRKGQRHIGDRVLRRMMARFPEYNALAIVYLFGSAAVRSESAADREHADAA